MIGNGSGSQRLPRLGRIPGMALPAPPLLRPLSGALCVGDRAFEVSRPEAVWLTLYVDGRTRSSDGAPALQLARRDCAADLPLMPHSLPTHRQQIPARGTLRVGNGVVMRITYGQVGLYRVFNCQRQPSFAFGRHIYCLGRDSQARANIRFIAPNASGSIRVSAWPTISPSSGKRLPPC